MKYDTIKKAVFQSRPNRFIATVMVDEEIHTVHVKNTGRCKELLCENAVVYLEDHGPLRKNRKTRYSLVAVEKSDANVHGGIRLVNIDSLAPNKVVGEAIKSGRLKLPGFEEKVMKIKPESTFGDSRLDFYMEGEKGSKAYLEVKGATLEQGGVVRFPDAPTERGIKHLKELEKAKSLGYLAYVIFVVQMQGVSYFEPNDETHFLFGQALREADKKGVPVLAYDCHVTVDEIELRDPVEVRLLSSSCL